MTPTTLTCACCGGEAPAYKQWYNQDTGHGVCAPCFTRIKAKGRYSDDELRSWYGVAGVHHSIDTPAPLLGQPMRDLSTPVDKSVDNLTSMKGTV